MITGISKVEQLKDILCKDIRNGVYQPGGKLPAISVIREKYNVSTHTVSQALSNLNELGVIELAHGKATRVAANPFQKRIDIIYAGITPIDQQEFWAEFYRGMSDEIKQHDGVQYNVKTINHLSDYKLAAHDLMKSSGVLLYGVSGKNWAGMLDKNDIPYTVVYDYQADLDDAYVSVDYKEVIRRIVDCFAAQGRTRVAYLGGLHEIIDQGINKEKYELLKEGLAAAGLEFDEALQRHVRHLMNEGYEMMIDILAAGQRPDAVFIASDSLAPGVYRALHEHGLTIPDDVVVAGCDNLQISKYLVPSLTTIELPRYEMGRLATKELIMKMNDPKSTLSKTLLQPKIIFRESLNNE